MSKWIGTDEEYIALANAAIAKRTNYGIRHIEKVNYTRRVYYWSNGSAKWCPGYSIRANSDNEWDLRLDANYIELPYISDKRAWELVSKFNMLPLFENSFEFTWENKKSSAPHGEHEEIEMAPNQIVRREAHGKAFDGEKNHKLK